MEWEEFWNNLLKTNAGKKIIEMNEVDSKNGNLFQMEKICHNIYDDYNKIEVDLKETEKAILDYLVKSLPDL